MRAIVLCYRLICHVLAPCSGELAIAALVATNDNRLGCCPNVMATLVEKYLRLPTSLDQSIDSQFEHIVTKMKRR